MKLMINMLKSGDANAQIAGSQYLPYSTTSSDARDPTNQSEAASWVTAESWIRGIMWVLVGVTIFWDVAVTFGPHFEWTRRFF
jgi:hypothetical protein